MKIHNPLFPWNRVLNKYRFISGIERKVIKTVKKLKPKTPIIPERLYQELHHFFVFGTELIHVSHFMVSIFHIKYRTDRKIIVIKDIFISINFYFGIYRIKIIIKDEDVFFNEPSKGLCPFGRYMINRYPDLAPKIKNILL